MLPALRRRAERAQRACVYVGGRGVETEVSRTMSPASRLVHSGITVLPPKVPAADRK